MLCQVMAGCLLCCDGHLPAGAENTAVQCHYDHQSGQAAAGVPDGSCQSGGCSEVFHCGHLAAAVPLHSSQVQGVQPIIDCVNKFVCYACQAHEEVSSEQSVGWGCVASLAPAGVVAL